MINQQRRKKARTEQIPNFIPRNFPLKSRLAEYLLNYLPIGTLLEPSIQISIDVITEEDSFNIAEQLLARFSDSANAAKLKEAMRERTLEAELAEAVSTFIERTTSKKYRFFRSLVIPLLEKEIRDDAPSYRHRADQMCKKLNLKEQEFSMVELSCCADLNPGLESLLNSHKMLEKPGLFACLLRMSRSKASSFLSCRGRLETNEVLLFSRHGNVSVTDTVFDFLIGNSGQEFATNSFQEAKPSKIPLDAFNLKAPQKSTLQQLVNAKDAINILFYGTAGTGKTELAKALATHCGKPAVFVNYGDKGDENDRKIALTTTANSIPPDTLIIVDEVDSLLNTRHVFRDTKINKGWINQFLDSSKHKIIWITNDVSSIEESVLRRFSYNLQFKPLTWRQRECIWLTQLRKHRIKRFFQTLEIQQLAKRFPVSPGLIAYSVKTIKQCRTPERSAPQLHAMLNEVLTRQMELTEGRTPKKKLNGINENYDFNALNTDANIPLLLQGLENFQHSDPDLGLNLLFWGDSGTGKTEFGKYLAARLGKELLVKRMSDLQSKWVGDTEKQIAAAFHEAEENNMILFLDEADSLFINRQTANRSWETSQTNEILTQMENFSGILICCTNLLDHLDEAAMRRFAFKIKFLPLTVDGALLLYREYFRSPGRSLSPEQEEALSRIRNVCPGDIKAVWQRTRFLGDTLTHGELILELEKEVFYKKGGDKTPIGFG